MNAASVNPYVFFLGCPRSGTTLLGRIGDAHPELAVVHESRFIPGWYEKRTGLSPEGDVTPALIERLSGHARFSRLGIEPAVLERVLEEHSPVTYADFVSAVFDLYGAARDKRFVGDKTPRYVRSIPTLGALWPHAKVVHLIRDGRDVCLSVLEWKKGPPNFSSWDEDPVSTTALWWEWQVRVGRAAGATLGADRYHELRYESLVGDPVPACVELCNFLRLPFDDAMLRFHEGRTRPEPGRSAKSAWLPVTPGIRSWREEMDRDDVARFEAAVGPLLDELGYERAAPEPTRAQLERAARLRARFAEEVRLRGRSVPAEWERAAA